MPMNKGLFVDFGVGLSKFKKDLTDMKQTWRSAMSAMEQEAKKSFAKISTDNKKNLNKSTAFANPGVFGMQRFKTTGKDYGNGSPMGSGAAVQVRRTEKMLALQKSLLGVYQKQTKLTDIGGGADPGYATRLAAAKKRQAEYIANSKKGNKVTEQSVKTSRSFADQLRDITRQKLKATQESARHSTALKLENSYFSRLRYQLVEAAAAYVSYRAVMNGAGALINTGRDIENAGFRNSVAFGNKKNYLDARRSMSVNSPFDKADRLEGMTNMMSSGIDAKKYGQLFRNASGATGQSVGEFSGNIKSAVYGDSGILRQYGIKNAQIRTLDLYGRTPIQRRDMILGMLKDNKYFIDGEKQAMNTLTGIQKNIGNRWTNFMEMIIGGADDKNSLYSRIKSGGQSVINWLTKNEKRLKRFATVASTVFKWLVSGVERVGKWLGTKFEGLLKYFDGSEEAFAKKTGKFLLFLELAKNKVGRFFKEWGGTIEWFVKFYLGKQLLGRLGKGGILGLVVGSMLSGDVRAIVKKAIDAFGGGWAVAGMISTYLFAKGSMALISAAARKWLFGGISSGFADAVGSSKGLIGRLTGGILGKLGLDIVGDKVATTVAKSQAAKKGTSTAARMLARGAGVAGASTLAEAALTGSAGTGAAGIAVTIVGIAAVAATAIGLAMVAAQGRKNRLQAWADPKRQGDARKIRYAGMMAIRNTTVAPSKDLEEGILAQQAGQTVEEFRAAKQRRVDEINEAIKATEQQQAEERLDAYLQKHPEELKKKHASAGTTIGEIHIHVDGSKSPQKTADAVLEAIRGGYPDAPGSRQAPGARTFSNTANV
jgi:hypothetical protein